MCYFGSAYFRKDRKKIHIPKAKPRTAYKVLRVKNTVKGVVYQSPHHLDRWIDNKMKGSISEGSFFAAGIYCFKTKKSAEFYQSQYGISGVIVKLRIWGHAYEYPYMRGTIYMDPKHSGYRVQNAEIVGEVS